MTQTKHYAEISAVKGILIILMEHISSFYAKNVSLRQYKNAK